MTKASPKLIEGSPAEEATESPAFEAREDVHPLPPSGNGVIHNSKPTGANGHRHLPHNFDPRNKKK